MLDKGRLSASLKRGWRIRVLGRLAILLFEKKPTLSKLIFPDIQTSGAPTRAPLSVSTCYSAWGTNKNMPGQVVLDMSSTPSLRERRKLGHCRVRKAMAANGLEKIHPFDRGEEQCRR